MIVALILAQLATSTTNCIPQHGMVTCSTQYQQPAPVPNVGQQMLDRSAEMQRQQNAAMAQASATHGQAIDFAWEQVGSLIAAGQCDRAKQLASFYNVKRLVDAANRVCK